LPLNDHRLKLGWFPVGSTLYQDTRSTSQDCDHDVFTLQQDCVSCYRLSNRSAFLSTPLVRDENLTLPRHSVA